MKYIAEKYSELCKTPSDINEHLPILYNHAKKCESVLETGVRGVISSWALIYGLLSNKDISAPRIFMNDIYDCGETEFFYYHHYEMARKGKLVVFPTDWTHLHRGIVSSTETKYILTGWYTFIPQDEREDEES